MAVKKFITIASVRTIIDGYDRSKTLARRFKGDHPAILAVKSLLTNAEVPEDATELSDLNQTQNPIPAGHFSVNELIKLYLLEYRDSGGNLIELGEGETRETLFALIREANDVNPLADSSASEITDYLSSRTAALMKLSQAGLLFDPLLNGCLDLAQRAESISRLVEILEKLTLGLKSNEKALLAHISVETLSCIIKATNDVRHHDKSLLYHSITYGETAALYDQKEAARAAILRQLCTEEWTDASLMNPDIFLLIVLSRSLTDEMRGLLLNIAKSIYTKEWKKDFSSKHLISGLANSARIFPDFIRRLAAIKMADASETYNYQRVERIVTSIDRIGVTSAKSTEFLNRFFARNIEKLNDKNLPLLQVDKLNLLAECVEKFPDIETELEAAFLDPEKHTNTCAAVQEILKLNFNDSLQHLLKLTLPALLKGIYTADKLRALIAVFAAHQELFLSLAKNNMPLVSRYIRSCYPTPALTAAVNTLTSRQVLNDEGFEVVIAVCVHVNVDSAQLDATISRTTDLLIAANERALTRDLLATFNDQPTFFTRLECFHRLCTTHPDLLHERFIQMINAERTASNAVNFCDEIIREYHRDRIHRTLDQIFEIGHEIAPGTAGTRPDMWRERDDRSVPGEAGKLAFSPQQ